MMRSPTLDIGPYLYSAELELCQTNMSTLFRAVEQRVSGARGEKDRVVLKFANLNVEKFSLTNQRAIENEEKWLIGLQHPNIVRLRPIAEKQHTGRQVYRARSELPGSPWFLVTDYLPGGDLKALLIDKHKLPASLALDIAEQVGAALVYIHGQKCVHCDIKPRNILFKRAPDGYRLTEDTRPILIDFGIAKSPNDGPQPVSGTLGWITPEMKEARDTGKRVAVQPSWDVYALGLVLYTMITGRKPDPDRPGSHSWQRITASDLAGDPSVVDTAALAANLNQLIVEATADESTKRIDATRFCSSIKSMRRLVRVPKEQTRTERRSGRGLWLTLGGVAAAAALGALVWFGAFQPGATVPGSGTPVALAPTVVLTPAGGDIAGALPGAELAAAEPSATPTLTAEPPTPTEPPPTVTRSPGLVPNLPAPATATSTSTSEPTSEPTSTALPTATATPTRAPTATPTRTSTPSPATAVPAAPKQPTPRPQPAASNVGVSLVSPPNNIATGGPVEFRWNVNGQLGANECYEVRFWQGDPNNWNNGFGLKDRSPDAGFNLWMEEAYEKQFPNNQLRPGETYYWGVILVQCDPYLPQRLASNVRTFTYVRPAK